MSHTTGRRTSEIPENVQPNVGDYVDPDNDYVVTSRLGHYVDRSDALTLGGRRNLGLRRIADPSQAREVWDSEKSDVGNSGIARLDVLRDSGAW